MTTATQRSLATAIASIHARWPDLKNVRSPERPVFVLAAGWRSGSTLLQRMLMPECFVWGEPYGHAGLLQSLADPLRCITNDWPEPHFFFHDENCDSVSERFIANLYPSVTTLLAAHRAYFDTLFEKPAREAQAERWGFKEVRLSADYAHYLKLLYPNSKLLFLIRNPYDAYRSWAARRNAGWKWFYRWPDQPVTARLFGRLWCELAGSFVEQADALGAHLIRYEDLKAGEYEAIEAYLGFQLNREAAKVRPDDGPKPIDVIPAAEFDELGDELHALAETLGYGPSRMDLWSVGEKGRTRGPSYEEADPARCVVLVPIGGTIVPQCEEALAELERRGYPVRRVRGYSAIDQGRNQMATDALADGFDETMWIDSDVGFDPNDVERLRRHEVPIVCGIYPQKGRRVLACHVMPGTEKLVFGDEGGLAEILYAGTGFLLVRRDAYETIRRKLHLPLCNERFGGRPMLPFFQPLSHPDTEGSETGGHWYLAEDFAFCERARQAGFKIFADTRVRLMHYGNYGYSWEDAGMELQRYRTFHFHTK
ncbi:MAG: sulfotransferase [Planctomycetota bacterium]|nr:sulfotransferase [Planctomycetota bacterium]